MEYIRILSSTEEQEIQSGVLKDVGTIAGKGLAAVAKGVGEFAKGLGSGLFADLKKKVKENSSIEKTAKRLNITNQEVKEEPRLLKVLEAASDYLEQNVKILNEGGQAVLQIKGEKHPFSDPNAALKAAIQYKDSWTSAVLKKNGLAKYATLIEPPDLDVDVKVPFSDGGKVDLNVAASRRMIDVRHIKISNRI